jgi:hypothetical protein
VGIQDRDRRIFDSLISLPYGTSYNSYLVQGADKTALVDTTNPGFKEGMEAVPYNLLVADVSHVAQDLVDDRAMMTWRRPAIWDTVLPVPSWPAPSSRCCCTLITEERTAL